MSDTFSSNLKERRDHLARARREMEAALITEEAPFDMDHLQDTDAFDTYVLQWLETRTEDFHRVFTELMNRHIDLVKEWREHPQQILGEIKTRMTLI